MTIAVICIALNALLVFGLGFLVSLRRVNTGKIYYGERLDPASNLAKAQRAHGNATEYAGVITALFVLCTILPAKSAWVPALMILITASRYIHALGFLTCSTLETPHWMKAIGATVTYFGGAAMCLTVVWDVLQHSAG